MKTRTGAVEMGWVQIENIFYESLCAIARTAYEVSVRNKIVDNLNRDIEFVKAQLEEYIISLDKAKVSEELLEVFTSRIDFQNKTNKAKNKTLNPFPKETAFLNFNYTSTICRYEDALMACGAESSFKHIPIYGTADSTYNPLIFGFGDEMDDNYKLIEKTNYNPFLDNIKSFGYFKTTHYRDLVGFINEEAFEIFIMGHSYGLSDRVMLNMIFENSNCKSIKIFYHQKGEHDNYKLLTQEISRHFNKKEMMREKVVPYDESTMLPQVST